MEYRGAERRRMPRVALRRNAVAFVGNEKFSGETIDVSRSGVGLRLHDRLPIGQFLRVNLGLGNHHWIDVDGVVVRESGGGHELGVRFMGLPPESERAIEEALSACKIRNMAAEPPPPERITARTTPAVAAAAPRRPPPPDDLLARCLDMKRRRTGLG